MTSEQGTTDLSPTARALLRDFRLHRGEVVCLPDGDLTRWQTRLSEVEKAAAPALLHEVIALAIRFHASGEPGARPGFVQLCELAVTLGGDPDRLQRSLPHEGLADRPPGDEVPVEQRPAPEGATKLRDLLLKS